MKSDETLCELCHLYALDELGELDAKRFERHLRSCARCRTEVAELRLLAQWVRADLQEECRREPATPAASHGMRFMSGRGRSFRSRWLRVAKVAWSVAAFGLFTTAGVSDGLTRAWMDRAFDSAAVHIHAEWQKERPVPVPVEHTAVFVRQVETRSASHLNEVLRTLRTLSRWPGMHVKL